MINTNPIVRIRRSAVPGKKPTVDQLLLGELGLNTYDANLYTVRSRPGIGTDIVNLGAGSTVTNILYVTKDGNDNNTGKKLGDAKATIKAAVAESTTGTVIKVSAGTYIEDNPIVLPDNVSVVGDSLREVTVTPQNQASLFQIGKGNYVAEMSFIGDPNPNPIFEFDPNEIRYIDQSPYIQNCTNFIPNSTGMKIDGNNAIGPLKSMVLDSYTQYNQGGIGVSITNEGYAQLVSLFTICDDTAVFCGTGAACDLTNSNSSFGNYALVADGVGPLKYVGVVTETVSASSDTVTLNLNTPTLSISTAYYDNTTGILTAYTTEAHKFSVGMGITLSNLQFTCAGIGGINIYPSGNKGYVFEAKTIAPGRYVDSYNLIQSNKREIQDKSLAAVAIAHSDFYFPGDDQTNSRSRYYDAYRLIQNNKSVIVDVAWTTTVGIHPEIASTENKCKRDLGYFVDAISIDVFTGGNKYSRDFVSQYFNQSGVFILPGSEIGPSIDAFTEARDLMKDAITNNLAGATYTDLTVTGDPNPGSDPPPYGIPGTTTNNTDPASCFNVQTNIDNLTSIVTTVIFQEDLTFLPTENLGTFTTGGNKCFRDIGYLIESLSLDVRDYTNKNVRNFIKGYFDANGNPITNGLTGELTESATAFNAVRDYVKKAITNQLNNKNLSLAADPVTGFNTDPGSCANVQTFIDNLVATVNSDSVGVATSKLNLPSVSIASTVFTCNVGVSTTPDQVYVGGGTAKINVIRPFDGQVVYFGDLFYTVDRIIVESGGSGYNFNPTVTIDPPQVSWGIGAQSAAVTRSGSVTEFEIISNGRGYTYPPKVTISSPDVGINTAKATAVLVPTYYSVLRSTPVSSGICTITLNDNIPYEVGIGTEAPFYKQSRVLASGHSLEYIGSGTDIARALPATGGVPIQDNETVMKNGGLVVFTSTDQSGNFRIGDGVIINQQTGTISGKFYSKSLFSTLTPFILALGGE
jgi:hypothetical protein